MWIPLGIVGQSIAAANNLEPRRGHAVGHDTANVLHLFGLVTAC